MAKAIKIRGKYHFDTHNFKTYAPREIANTALNHFKLGFRTEGGQTNASKGGWPPRKYKTKQDRRTRRKRNLLVQQGTLKRSIRKLQVSLRRITIGSRGVPHAEIQNEGGTIQHPGGTPYIMTSAGPRWLKKDGNYPPGVRFTKPHPIQIPQREFIGPSDELERKIRRIINKWLKRDL
jgi:phage gpG-like protein